MDPLADLPEQPTEAAAKRSRERAAAGVVPWGTLVLAIALIGLGMLVGRYVLSGASPPVAVAEDRPPAEAAGSQLAAATAFDGGPCPSQPVASPAAASSAAANPTAPSPSPTAVPIHASDVDLTMTLSRDVLVAGDSWSVIGEIRNRSQASCLWIVDRTTTLMLPPEIYGEATSRLALPASFPTYDYPDDTPNDQVDRVVRIDPGTRYAMIWSVDTRPGRRRTGGGGLAAVTDPPRLALENYLYFYPGKARPIATVLIWYRQPTLDPTNARVVDRANAFPLTFERETDVEVSQWVLIVGAALGGWLGRAIQVVFGTARFIPPASAGARANREAEAWARRRARFWWHVKGSLGALLLPAITTVLIARLAGSELPISVKVNDVWGSLAIGFLVQLLGYQWLRRFLDERTATPQTPPVERAVSVSPSTLSAAQIANGGARVSVSGRGLDPSAQSLAVWFVDPTIQTARMVKELKAEAPDITRSNGTFSSVQFALPADVAAGRYKIQVVTDAGSVLTGAEQVTVT